MKILIDLESLFKLNLTANEYIMLLSYHVDHKGFELYSEIIRSVNLHKLETLGYIKVTDKVNLRLKAINLFKDLDLDVPVENPIPIKRDPRLTDEFLTNYRELWPKGVTSGGRMVRQSVTSLETKFKGFFSRYEYTTQEILDATRNYIKRFSYKQYQGISCCDYFVEKFGVSILASEIDNIKENKGTKDKIDHSDDI